MRPITSSRQTRRTSSTCSRNAVAGQTRIQQRSCKTSAGSQRQQSREQKDFARSGCATHDCNPSAAHVNRPKGTLPFTRSGCTVPRGTAPSIARHKAKKACRIRIRRNPVRLFAGVAPCKSQKDDANLYEELQQRQPPRQKVLASCGAADITIALDASREISGQKQMVGRW